MNELLQLVAAGFPNDELPAIIQELFRYQTGTGEISGEFRVDHTGHRFIENIPEPASFAPFGSNYTGSVYCIWSGEDSPISYDEIENRPVVYLDSEAVYSSVISKNLRDFVSLLLVGHDDIGSLAGKNNLAPEGTPSKKVRRFRTWAEHSLGVSVATDPNQVLREAKLKHHNDFVEWYNRWQGVDPWTNPPE